jgi:2-dehydro-3-deoxyphosphogluconate aldolase / (4S)-4-hydroxy-2-oxoglutarate aldolase
MTSPAPSSPFDELDRSKVMAILGGADPEETARLCHRAWELGIAMVEVQVRADCDLEALASAVAAGRRENRPVGAGTVTSPEMVRLVADIGAAFTVAPGLDPDVAEASARLGLAHLPGVATATEVQRALSLGLRWQKAFPAAVLGTGWFAAMRGPFRQARFVATGGISTGNAAAFLDAGATAVSLGSAFAGSPGQQIRALVGHKAG